jgi:integrase
MKTDAANDAKVIQKNGISVRIRPTLKDGTTYFVLDYRAKGKRKLVWRSTMAEARTAANEAIDKITEGQAEVLNLTSTDAHVYIRTRDALVGLEMDTAAKEYAEAHRLLAGRATVLEVCRDWLKRNAVALPKITVADAVAEFNRHCVADGKSALRKREIFSVLKRLAAAFNVEVLALEPKLIADYLTAMPLSERTKRNHRDIISYFNRWLVLRGYLAKGTDWLDGVQNYSAQKLGEIEIYTTDEMRRLIAAADKRILPLIVIGGFAGLRHAEIARLDWQDIDLADGFIEVKAQNAKTKTRRIVPVKDNLKQFLLPLAKKSGPVITLANTTSPLLKTAADTGDAAKEIKALEWKHNALRHTYISARVAECADVPRVADEAGNSPQIIRTNYLKRLRPAAAAEWFAIAPQQKTGK